MRILHLSTSSTGGAGRAATRMNASLNYIGQDSKIIYLAGSGAVQGENESAIKRSLIKKGMSSGLTLIQRELVQSGSDPVTPVSFNAISIKEILKTKPDIVHIHNFYNLLSFKTIVNLAHEVKVVVTLHDQRMFTAGCHYSHQCNGFQKTCGACPQMTLGSQSIAESAFKRNMTNLASNSTELNLISPSRWLLEKARENKEFQGFPGAIIKNPIPSYSILRENKSLDHKLHIGFCSDLLSNPLKGLDILIQALQNLNRDFVLHLIGRNLGRYVIPNEVEYELHKSRTEIELLEKFSKLDVLVVPSLEDNSPNVVGEALMSGTRVIGSDVGGLGELLVDVDMDTFNPSNPLELTRLLMNFELDYSKTAIAEDARKIFAYQVIAPKVLEFYHG